MGEGGASPTHTPPRLSHVQVVVRILLVQVVRGVRFVEDLPGVGRGLQQGRLPTTGKDKGVGGVSAHGTRDGVGGRQRRDGWRAGRVSGGFGEAEERWEEATIIWWVSGQKGHRGKRAPVQSGGRGGVSCPEVGCRAEAGGVQGASPLGEGAEQRESMRHPPPGWGYRAEMGGVQEGCRGEAGGLRGGGVSPGASAPLTFGR